MVSMLAGSGRPRSDRVASRKAPRGGHPRMGRWIAALVALPVLAGCGTQSVALQEAPADRLDLGVVAVTAQIGGDREQSAGVVFDADRGLVLTTAHGVWGARSLKVATGVAVLHGRILA